MKKTCAVSGVEFEITDKDVEFYEKMGVSAPTLCPDERKRRRLAWQNMQCLYHRKCDVTGKKIISNFSPEKKIKVYDQEFWWGDNWDFRDFGIDFDFSKTFFENWKLLLQSVPLPNLFTEFTKDENSRHTNFSGSNKNCYLIFHADMNRDCYFGTGVKKCESCVDNLMVFESELLYECVDCRKCYDLKFSQDCENCSSSWFLKNCFGCKDCFGCTNLRQKEYFLFNKQVSKEEYAEFVSAFESSKYSGLQKLYGQFIDFQKTQIHRATQGYQNENCEGDHIYRSKDVLESFDVQESRDMKFCERIYNGPNSDCYDLDQFGMHIEKVYEGHAIGVQSQNVISCFQSYALSDVSYSGYSFNSENCFGCLGMYRGKFCILNKQYSEEEYFALRDKIIEHMKKTGEWGEFFPTELSPFGYNETVANEYFPLTKEEAVSRGFQWKDLDKKDYLPQKIEIPDAIEDVQDSIYEEILACSDCGKNYKIQKAEMAFYEKMKLPLPRKCPDCRHLARTKLRNPRKLFDRKCGKCLDPIKTTFTPERQEQVYCEKCYLEAVN